MGGICTVGEETTGQSRNQEFQPCFLLVLFEERFPYIVTDKNALTSLPSRFDHIAPISDHIKYLTHLLLTVVDAVVAAPTERIIYRKTKALYFSLSFFFACIFIIRLMENLFSSSPSASSYRQVRTLSTTTALLFFF